MNREIDRSTLPELYQTAFTRDHSALFGGRHMRFSVVRGGMLSVPSGRIVACDPLVGNQRQSFVQTVLPGRYPVDFSLGHDAIDAAERILFSRILFTKNNPTIWVKALCESEAGQEEGDGFGFIASSGTVAYLDQESAALFRLDSMVDLDLFLDKLVGNYRPKRSWLNHPLDDEHNAIFFTSSHSDRPVPTYFAIDDGGDVCLALTSLYL